MKNNVTIYTDGGCRGNGTENALGAYGIVLDDGQNRKEVKKAVRGTTNNVMELTAVIEALRLLKTPCNVTIYSDSAYVVNATNNKWISNWQMNGWRNSKKEPVANKELWLELIKVKSIHNVTFIKVKGHSDNKGNDRCDELVNEAMDEMEAKE